MTDLAAAYDSTIMAADLALDGALLKADDGLATAIVISIFTDRRANPDDELPSGGQFGGGGDSRRGWFGDALPPKVAGEPVANDRIGSRLWLLAREKQTAETMARAREYIAEAVEWLIEDGVCTRIDVDVWVERPGVMGFTVTPWRPDGSSVEFTYHTAWEAQANAV